MSSKQQRPAPQTPANLMSPAQFRHKTEENEAARVVDATKATKAAKATGGYTSQDARAKPRADEDKEAEENDDSSGLAGSWAEHLRSMGGPLMHQHRPFNEYLESVGGPAVENFRLNADGSASMTLPQFEHRSVSSVPTTASDGTLVMTFSDGAWAWGGLGALRSDYY